MENPGSRTRIYNMSKTGMFLSQKGHVKTSKCFITLLINNLNQIFGSFNQFKMIGIIVVEVINFNLNAIRIENTRLLAGVGDNLFPRNIAVSI